MMLLHEYLCACTRRHIGCGHSCYVYINTYVCLCCVRVQGHGRDEMLTNLTCYNMDICVCNCVCVLGGHAGLGRGVDAWHRQARRHCHVTNQRTCVCARVFVDAKDCVDMKLVVIFIGIVCVCVCVCVCV